MPKAPAITANEMTETVETKHPPKQSLETVIVKVTKFGDGKVSTGVHVAAEGDVMAKRDDLIEVSKTVAKALESFGLAEIQ